MQGSHDFGKESSRQFFSMNDPIDSAFDSHGENGSATSSRNGVSVPKDLEQRLQNAWLQTQLRSSKPKDSSPAESRLLAYRPIKQDLTDALENLWMKSQVPVAIPRNGRASVTTSISSTSASTGSSHGNRKLVNGQSIAKGSNGRASRTAWLPPQKLGGSAPSVRDTQRGSAETASVLQLPPSVSLESHLQAPGREEAARAADLGASRLEDVAGTEAEGILDGDALQWLADLEALQSVPISNEYMEEEFLRGLDGLNSAFAELEQLLPSPQHLTHSYNPNAAMDSADHVAGPSTGSAIDPPGYLQWNEQLDSHDPTSALIVSHDHNSHNIDLLPEPIDQPLSETLTLETEGSGRKRKPHLESGTAGEDMAADAPVPALRVKRAEDEQVDSAGVKELLMSIAHGVAVGDMAAVQPQLTRLSAVASTYGSATQRLSAYFLEGLVARVSGSHVATHTSQPIPLHNPYCGASLMNAFEVLVAASPFLTFGHVACNSAILEAFEGHNEVHIVDFGLGQGIQWPPLIQALSVRTGGPPRLHITGVDMWVPAGVKPAHCIIAAGKRLETIAKLWNVPLEYEALRSKLEDVRPQHIHTRPGEVLAVNCALRLHSLLDESVTPSNPRSAVLRTIRALNPSILTIVEQNTDQNSPFFLSRFYEAVHYYTAMFESMEQSLPQFSQERRVFEQQVLGRAIVNVVACEGKDRVQRQESLGLWQVRVKRAGFAPRPLGKNVVRTVQSLLDTYKEGYRLSQEDEGSLLLKWNGRSLLAMSAWECDPLCV